MIILLRYTTLNHKKLSLISSKRRFFLSRFQSPSLSLNNNSSIEQGLKTEIIIPAQCKSPSQSLSPTRPTSLTSLENTEKYNEFENSQLRQLADSILLKLDELPIDKTFEGSSDLYLLKKSTFDRPFINPIDLHILENSKIMTPTTRFNTQNHLTSKILNVHDKFLKNNTYYDYKFDLINKFNPIEELKILNTFMKRLTLSNYQNSNELIKSFLKNRIIYSNNSDILFNNNRQLAYLLLDYFLKNYNHRNILVVKQIIKLMGNWDIFSLNVYLKNLIQLNVDSYQNLNVLNSILSTFLINNIKLNKTSIYLIYSHIQKLNELSLFKHDSLRDLKYQLQKRLLNENLINSHKITAIIFEDISRSFTLLRKYQTQKDIAKKIQLELFNSINLLSKFQTTEKLKISNKNLTSKSFRKLFSSTKYKDMSSFSSLLLIHLSVNNWKFTWDSIALNYNLLKDQNFSTATIISKECKAKLLKENSPTKFTDFGRIFNYDLVKFKNYVKTSASYYLLSHTSSISNWQLFIRSLNEFNLMTNNEGVSYSVYRKSLNHLLDINLLKSNLDPLTYLLLIKFLLHKSLLTEMGSVKRSDVLFIKFQSKVDNIFNTNFRNSNLQTWLSKRSSVRTELEKNASQETKLFESCFGLNLQPKKTIFEEKVEVKEVPSPLPTHDFISSDLSIITPFEKFLFERIGKLRVLDSVEKITSEYNEYSKFWDSKNINLKDVQSNYHLGFINQSYKNDMIKWENSALSKIENELGSKISTIYKDESSDSNLNDFKINKLNKLNDVINENLTSLLNKTEDYIVISKTSSNSGSKFRRLNPTSSLNNLLPNDWLHIVLQKSLNDWMVNQLVKKD